VAAKIEGRYLFKLQSIVNDLNMSFAILSILSTNLITTSS